MTDISECAWCGAEIEDGGLPYKNMMFCSEDCKADWDDDNVDVANLDLDDLEERDLLSDELDDFGEDLDLDVDDIEY